MVFYLNHNYFRSVSKRLRDLRLKFSDMERKRKGKQKQTDFFSFSSKSRIEIQFSNILQKKYQSF